MRRDPGREEPRPEKCLHHVTPPVARLLKAGASRPPCSSSPRRSPLDSGTDTMCAAQRSAAALAAAAPRTVYAFSARPLAGGEPFNLSSLRGKVLLIENVASL